MSCLRIPEIYAYLEGDLPAVRQTEITSHLSLCARCQRAVQERRILEAASSSLPDLELPSDFSRRVMSRIAGREAILPGWLIGLLVGLSSVGLACFLLLLSGGELSLALISGFHRFFLAYFKNATVFLSKGMILLSSIGKIFHLIATAVQKFLFLLPGLIPPPVQALLLLSALAALIGLYFGLKNRLLPGERT